MGLHVAVVRTVMMHISSRRLIIYLQHRHRVPVSGLRGRCLDQRVVGFCARLRICPHQRICNHCHASTLFPFLPGGKKKAIVGAQLSRALSWLARLALGQKANVAAHSSQHWSHITLI